MPTDCILIHGVLPRSGTNFLNRILRLHPDCYQTESKVREDWFLHESGLVDQFCENLFKRWDNPKWQGEAFDRSKFKAALGTGLQTFLRGQNPDNKRTLVMKTPSVENLNRVFDYFPSAKLLIMMRDGRDVAASAQKTWNRPLKLSAKQWKEAAQTIANFRDNTPAEQFKIVKFESLHQELREQTESILQFVGLSADRYPWDELAKIPVAGSSTKGWTDVEKDASFQPIGRWQDWTDREKKRFQKLTSPWLEHFGYSN